MKVDTYKLQLAAPCQKGAGSGGGGPLLGSLGCVFGLVS